MIIHDSVFETLAEAPVKASDVVVVRQFQDPYGFIDDTTAEWTSSDYLMSATIDSVGNFLGTVTKKATVKLLGIIDTALEGDIFQIRLGLYNTDPSVSGFDYISEGFFIVDSIAFDYEAGSTTVTLYDHMWTASRTPYTTGIVTYPLTVTELAQGMASTLGLDLMADFEVLPNASYEIAEDLYANLSNATLQTVIQEIAASTGTTARVSDTTLTFVSYNSRPTPFADDFNTLDTTTKWSGGSYNTGTMSIVNGQLNIGLPSSSTQYHGLISPRFNMTGKQVSMKLVSAGNQALTSLEAYPVQVRNAGNTEALLWVVTGGLKLAQKIVASVRTTVHSSAYSSTNDKYFRVREALGTTYWETSADGYTWTIDYSMANPIDVSSLVAEPTAGTWASEASSSTIVYDKFNILQSRRVGELPDVDEEEPEEEILDSDLLKKLKIGNKYGPVTSVVLGRVPQNDNVAESNSKSISNTITSVNTTTNLITITGNEMEDGTLVQLASTGTLPAPLLADTNYFIWTNGSADTFALTPTFQDGIDGTNVIDLTTAGTGTITLTELETQEVQINNVEILDDDRQDLLPPLYNALLGIGWNASTSETIGLGWHEVGDVIFYQQGSTVVQSLLSEVHLTLAGSIKETLVSVVPDPSTINYQTAGGILKTIYDTEIKVDKQGNDITSIVSQQITDGINTTNAFTEVYQTINNVTTQIQSVGGGNLILNSVGYAKEVDGSLSFWTKTGTGTVTSYSSAGSLSSGAISGNAIQLVGASPKITQRLTVANTSAYSIGFRVNKLLGDGSATVTLSNDVTSYTIPIASGTGYVWEELKLENITPGQNYWDITIEVTGTTASIEITDLRVMNGPTLVAWDQSHSEILNTQVALTTEGIRVSSSTHAGDYTVMTPLEFAGYSDASGTSQKVFWVNRDTTEVANMQIDGNVNFGNVIRAIPITSGTIQGLAFVGAIS